MEQGQTSPKQSQNDAHRKWPLKGGDGHSFCFLSLVRPLGSQFQDTQFPSLREFE